MIGIGLGITAGGALGGEAVPAAPTVTSVDISPDSGVVGDTFTASASATGSPAPTITYQWLLDASPVGTGSTYQTDTAGTLTVTATATNSEGVDSATSAGVTVAAVDTTPDAFDFTDQSDAALSTVYTSAWVQITGTNAPAAASVTGGEYQFADDGSGTNATAWTSAGTNHQPGQWARVRGTSSASNSTAVDVALTIGGVTGTYSITTEAAAVAAPVLPASITALDLTAGDTGTVDLTSNNSGGAATEWRVFDSDTATFGDGSDTVYDPGDTVFTDGLEPWEGYDPDTGIYSYTSAAEMTVNQRTVVARNASGEDQATWDVTVEAAAAGITVVGSATAEVPLGESTTTINLPAGLQENDIVVFALGSDGAGDSTKVLSAGWTAFGPIDPAHEFKWKRMGASPDASVDVQQNSDRVSAVAIQAFRRVDPTTAMDATPTVSAYVTGGMPDAPSITTVTDGALVVAIGWLDDAVSPLQFSIDSVVAPTGYSDLVKVNTETAASVTGASIFMASKAVASAGAEDPGVFGGDGDDMWLGATIALRPAA